MLLREALQLNRQKNIFFVGGGGKSSSLKLLAEELRAQGKRVILGTTAKVLRDEFSFCKIVYEGESFPDEISDALAQGEIPFLSGGYLPDKGKLKGFSEETFRRLKELFPEAYILIEGDGSRNKPFKAPKEHEPVIYEGADLVVFVIGAECLGQPITEQYFYNVEGVLRLSESHAGESLDVSKALKVLDSPWGGRKNLHGSELVLLINKAEGEMYKKARELALAFSKTGKAIIASIREKKFEVIE